MSEQNATYSIDTETFEIPDQGRSHAREKYPWSLLEIGQSFFAPGVKPSALSSTAWKKKEKLGRTFVIREATKDGQSGCRVWRTS